jgi:hypothetical protein
MKTNPPQNATNASGRIVLLDHRPVSAVVGDWVFVVLPRPRIVLELR